jgi:hypothetical protein
MQKSMIAKYSGVCAISGARINKGDDIVFDTVTRKTWFSEPGDCQIVDDDSNYLAIKTRTNPNYVSDVYSIGGREYYRNKRGLCIDAPCCGCCST